MSNAAKIGNSLSVWDLDRADARADALAVLKGLGVWFRKHRVRREDGRYFVLLFTEFTARGVGASIKDAAALHWRMRNLFTRSKAKLATQIIVMGLPDTVRIAESVVEQFNPRASIILRIQPELPALTVR
jgi:hypothetical protein